jgi:citrate lyase beta subunit
MSAAAREQLGYEARRLRALVDVLDDLEDGTLARRDAEQRSHLRACLLDGLRQGATAIHTLTTAMGRRDSDAARARPRTASRAVHERTARR